MAFLLRQPIEGGPERIGADRVHVRARPFAELGGAAIYVLFASIWTVFSEDWLDRLFSDPPDSPALKALIGLNFIMTTGLVLYLVLRRSYHRRRLAEEAARLNHERFESVARATTDVIWDWNLETNAIWWSDGFQRVFGYEVDELSPTTDWWLARLHPEDKSRVVAAIQQAVESGGQRWVGRYRFQCKNGSYATVQDQGYILRDAVGRAVRVIGGISDITERRNAEEALASSHQQLRALSVRLQSAREDERTHVAREIHDELGQVLTALKINLDWMERRIGERENDPTLNPVLERIVESGAITETAIASVQRIATELRPVLLDSFGLETAIQQEAERFRERTGIACDLCLPAPWPKPPPNITTALFRIFQEALTNVARHARASRVTITLRTENAHWILEMEDDGCGISTEAVADLNSLGLLGMRERAAALGGQVAVGPVGPRGTRVAARIPDPGSTAAAE